MVDDRAQLAMPVVGASGAPVGLLGWDDSVRFALARGALDPCWRNRPATAVRAMGAITPIADIAQRRLGPVTSLHDVAVAMLRVPPGLGRPNDWTQYLIADGFVTPYDLLRAIFFPTE